jgi:rhamnopyranosyl-N-acetylglucosaminyl-diphospho-decaprenol beta-1,3/1,4-galactofuranosyltransferase
MGAELSADGSRGLDEVTAVVLTHLRPRLATATVRSLIDVEGFTPERVVVVVNGEGGLEDPVLERSVRMLRLPSNLGPAEGFRRGMVEAFSDPSVRWAYLCEDDMVLLGLPQPRVAGLLARVTTPEANGARGPVGAVVPFGRRFVARSGHTVNVVPRRGLPAELAPVDVSTWGATLLSRQVVDAGILPDSALFFGFEDFDFFCRLRAAGFSLLVDVPTARRVVHRQTLAGRDDALRHERPIDADEPWRAYYFARNFFALARRHGRPSWYAWHLLFSVRRLQLARSGRERRAILEGLRDGARGRLGMNPRYLRRVGEVPAPPPDATSGSKRHCDPARPTPADLAEGVVALVLSHNAPGALARCLAAVAAQSVPPAAVVVVDNASDPPVAPRRLAGGRGAVAVSVVRSETNLGPAGGWALALGEFRSSVFDHAWVLDDDIVPDPDCLEVLLGAVRGDPKRAFCFPYSVQPDGSAAPWGAWCGLVVAKSIVEQVGLPRPEFFWWAEDNEYLLWRIPQAGFERRIVDGAVVQHNAVRQSGSVPLWKYYYEARNMLYLHLHVKRKVGWYPRNVTKLVGRAVLRERGRRIRCLLTIGRGLADGARGALGMRFPVEAMQEQGARPAGPQDAGTAT